MIVRLRRLAPEAEEEEWAHHAADIAQGQLTLSRTTVYPASTPTCCSRPLLRRNVVQLSVRPTARAQQTAARRFSPFLLFGVDLLTVKRMMTRLALLTRQVRSSRPWAGEVPATRCHRTRPSTIQEKPPTYASLFSTIRCRKRNCKTSRDVQLSPTTLDIFNEQARPTLDPQSDANISGVLT